MNVYSDQHAGVLFWQAGPVPGAAPVVSANTIVPGWKVYADGAVIVWPILSGTTVATPSDRDLGVKKLRRRAKLKHIQDEQRVEKDYLDSLNPKPAAQPKAKARPAPAPAEQPTPVVAKPVAVVESVPTVAEMAQSMKAMQAQLEQMQEALKKVEFENKYWARFATLMMQNTH